MEQIIKESFEKCNKKFLEFWEKNSELIKKINIKTILLNNNLSDFELHKIENEKYNYYLNLYGNDKKKYSLMVDYIPAKMDHWEELMNDKTYSKNFTDHINVIVAFAETIDLIKLK